MIHENIQFFRREKGLTQEALAELVGVSRQTIAKWEAGESTPDLELAGRLAQALDASLDELINAPMPTVAENLHPQGKHIFGLVTVGDKGQIVIPVKARRMFGITPGTQLLVLGDENQGLALMDSRFFLLAGEVIRNAEK